MNPSPPALLRALLLAAAGLPLAAAAQTAIGPGAAAQAAAPAELRPAPDPRAAYLAVLQELKAGGQHYAVLAHLKTFEAQHGPSPESQRLRADALRATQQPEAAAAAYEALLKTPLAAAGHHGLGRLAAQRGDLERALAQFRRAVDLAPTDATLHSDLGYALLLLQRPGEARTPLMTAAQLAPEDPQVLANLALMHARLGERAEMAAVLARPGVSEATRQQMQALLASEAPARGAEAGAAARTQAVGLSPTVDARALPAGSLEAPPRLAEIPPAATPTPAAPALAPPRPAMAAPPPAAPRPVGPGATAALASPGPASLALPAGPETVPLRIERQLKLSPPRPAPGAASGASR